MAESTTSQSAKIVDTVEGPPKNILVYSVDKIWHLQHTSGETVPTYANNTRALRSYTGDLFPGNVYRLYLGDPSGGKGVYVQEKEDSELLRITDTKHSGFSLVKVGHIILHDFSASLSGNLRDNPGQREASWQGGQLTILDPIEDSKVTHASVAQPGTIGYHGHYDDHKAWLAGSLGRWT